jgi:hypothetical protein
MGPLWGLLVVLVLTGITPAAAQFSRPAGLGLSASPGLSRPEFQALLQRFVDEQHLRSFRDLGIEEDFDHAHLLFDSRRPGRPVAILYHTQELGSHPGMDPKARNWLQWVGRGTVEDASRYERKSYPRSASWDWFLHRELKALRQRHTILDKMLDPALLGIESTQSRQWVFTRTDCGGAAQPSADSSRIRIVLPAGPVVCLALSQT